MTQTKTLKIRIYATEEQSKKFQELTMAYRDAENFISQYIFDHDCDTNFYRVCKEVYYQIRERFRLKAQISQACVKEVISLSREWKNLQGEERFLVALKTSEIQEVNRDVGYQQRLVVHERED